MSIGVSTGAGTLDKRRYSAAFSSFQKSGAVFCQLRERLKAEDDLSRPMLADKLKAIHNVVEGFENLPQAITDL
jgi:hypothetical protein